MVKLIGLFCFVINFFVLLWDRNKGIVLYCIMSMTAPVMVFFGVSIKYEILSIPLLLYILLTKKGSIKFNIIHFFWFCWFVWLMVVTVFSPLRSTFRSEVEWITIIGLARYFFVYYILAEERILQDKFVDIIRYTTYINTIFVIFQFIFSRVFSGKWVLELMLQLYGTIGNNGALSIDASIGNMGRYYGAFSTTSYLGTFSILGMILFFQELRITVSFSNIISFVCSTLLGVVSSTKRFYLGIVAIFVYYVIIQLFVEKGRIKVNYTRIIKLSLLILSSFIIMLAIIRNFIDEAMFKFYSSYLIEGRFLESFQTRFSSTGAVQSMRQGIRDNLVTGVGMISIPGVNATDSEFYVILYKSGVVGLVLTVAFIRSIFVRFMNKKNIVKFMVFGIVVFEFFISTEFYSFMGILFLAYLSGRICERYEPKKYMIEDMEFPCIQKGVKV